MTDDPLDDVAGGVPSRRVTLGLTRGAVMHISMPGLPNEPVGERTLDALRQIGEAALDRIDDTAVADAATAAASELP